MEASACSVFLIDAKRKQLWSVASDSGREFRIPLDAGIAGAVATTGETINIAGVSQPVSSQQANGVASCLNLLLRGVCT